jgi:hypothetical protein
MALHMHVEYHKCMQMVSLRSGRILDEHLSLPLQTNYTTKWLRIGALTKKHRIREQALGPCKMDDTVCGALGVQWLMTSLFCFVSLFPHSVNDQPCLRVWCLDVSFKLIITK